MMIMLTQDEFEKIVSIAIDAIPEKYFKRLNNVAFVSADDPSPEQRRKLKLRDNQSLFGLYEGVPLTKRASGYNMVLPDKITIFKNPIEQASSSMDELQKLVQNTVWHEVAHYFGLDHTQIHELENR
jgi:predicted Zn-dependent protease with MMP-like domain